MTGPWPSFGGPKFCLKHTSVSSTLSEFHRRESMNITNPFVYLLQAGHCTRRWGWKVKEPLKVPPGSTGSTCAGTTFLLQADHLTRAQLQSILPSSADVPTTPQGLTGASWPHSPHLTPSVCQPSPSTDIIFSKDTSSNVDQFQVHVSREGRRLWWGGRGAGEWALASHHTSLLLLWGPSLVPSSSL